MENIRYRALALDLDGTLMDSNKKLSQENREAIWQAIEQDTAVILASGRPLFGVLPVAEALELDKRGGYVLAYNGGNIWDCKAGKLVHSRMIPQNCIADICAAARAHEVCALTYYENRIVAESDTDEYVLKEAFCNSTTVQKVDDLPSFVDYPVAKLLVVGVHEKLVFVQEKLKEMYNDVLDIFFSETYFLEIVPKNVAKDAALEALLVQLGITREELVACGDGMNDICMLDYAGMGVAMQNAYPKVKEHAQYIAPSNDENGVAEVIAKFFINSCR